MHIGKEGLDLGPNCVRNSAGILKEFSKKLISTNINKRKKA